MQVCVCCGIIHVVFRMFDIECTVTGKKIMEMFLFIDIAIINIVEILC
jgi:hypothetical protein